MEKALVNMKGFVLSLVLLFQGYFCKNLLDPNSIRNYKTLKTINTLQTPSALCNYESFDFIYSLACWMRKFY